MLKSRSKSIVIVPLLATAALLSSANAASKQLPETRLRVAHD